MKTLASFWIVLAVATLCVAGEAPRLYAGSQPHDPRR